MTRSISRASWRTARTDLATRRTHSRRAAARVARRPKRVHRDRADREPLEAVRRANGAPRRRAARAGLADRLAEDVAEKPERARQISLGRFEPLGAQSRWRVDEMRLTQRHACLPKHRDRVRCALRRRRRRGAEALQRRARGHQSRRSAHGTVRHRRLGRSHSTSVARRPPRRIALVVNTDPGMYMIGYLRARPSPKILSTTTERRGAARRREEGHQATSNVESRRRHLGDRGVHDPTELAHERQRHKHGKMFPSTGIATALFPPDRGTVLASEQIFPQRRRRLGVHHPLRRRIDQSEEEKWEVEGN